MSDLDICIVTFNCARELTDSHVFAQSLHEALSTTASPPDLLVLALQELAPIAYSFIGGPYLTPYFNRFEDAISTLADMWTGTTMGYELLQSLNVGMTAIMIFAQPDVSRSITSLETAAVRVGNYELGNKGAVGVRLYHHNPSADSTPLTFLSAHLAPHEGAWENRNRDWATIASNLMFETTSPSSTRSQSSSQPESEPLLSTPSPNKASLSGTILSPSGPLFLAGDLNYRTSDLPPHPSAHETWPVPSLHLSSPRNETDNPSLPSSPFGELWSTDQLTRERKEGRTFHTLSEADVVFPPTYKYSDAARAFARKNTPADPKKRSAGGEGEAAAAAAAASAVAEGLDDRAVWAKHRQPSWCDRVLFRGSVRVQRYAAMGLQGSSDHRPVVLRCSVPLQGSATGQEQEQEQEQEQGQRELERERERMPFALDPGWRTKRDRSRAKELGVGVLAYLITTWEGWVVLLGMVAGGLGLGALGRSFGW
ncbi:hypothetical protein CAC42_5865 [Sphaceloma murrayae]|uniref:Inositol polyphosphate-related phosphatase domain-containing protein n=1 Tax=Sphaceloma murrayae TaxID=2082308 RepID=A0A2K1QZD4_9PEZI|nr:hypothetical protein CAC42_5865 [Sphaceloma murrayae]